MGTTEIKNENTIRKPHNILIDPEALNRTRVEALHSKKTVGEWLEEAIEVTEQMTDKLCRTRTTIGLKVTTKDKLDKNRAPGQCYDGFIQQLVELWERNNSK